MATQAEATLTEREHEVVDRFAEALRERLGDRLRSVWLYGSRARGEEARPDSDVDLLIVVDRDDEDSRDIVHRTMSEVAKEVGADPFAFSIITRDPDWIRGRREIRAFFIQEVDRDKVVLYGDPDSAAAANRSGGVAASPGVVAGAMTPRSEEYAGLARRRLDAAERMLEDEHFDVTIGLAYYAMFNAAHAGLSERDRTRRRTMEPGPSSAASSCARASSRSLSTMPPARRRACVTRPITAPSDSTARERSGSSPPQSPSSTLPSRRPRRRARAGREPPPAPLASPR